MSYISKLTGALLSELGLISISKKKLIIMSGSPRSGTTFVAENISRALGGIPLVWEPLQDENLLRVDSRDFCIRPVWKDLIDNERVFKLINSIFISGRVNYYQSYSINFSKVKAFFSNSDTALIKFTRGNGIVNELVQTYPNVIYGFVVLRNPYAVISSQIRHHEFNGHPAYSENSKAATLANKALQDLPQSNVRDLTISWCCDYINAFENEQKVIYYEELVDDFKIILKDINEKTGLQPLPERVNTLKPSSTFKDSSGSINYKNKYKKNLSDQMIEDISEVLDLFGIKYPYV